MIAKIDRERLFFLVLVAVMVGLLWVPTYPPMVDIPQHAGQVAQLKALLTGGGKWQDQVEINYLTPYWIGYGLWLLFAFIMPLKIALKLLLSLCFLAFVFSFSTLGKKFSAPKILDWILVPCFFGYAYEFGMITFLLALSVGVLFFLVNMRWERSNDWRWGGVVLVSGIALFFSHGLVFLFFCLASTAYIAVRRQFRFSQLWKFVWPYIPLLLLFLFYMSQPDPLASHYSYDIAGLIWGGFVTHLRGLFTMPWGVEPPGIAPFLLSALGFVLPFLMGFRLRREPQYYVLIVCTLIVFFALPHYISNTFFLFQRFAILIFPSYIICFYKPDIPASETVVTGPSVLMGRLLWGLLMIGLLYRPVTNLVLFNSETAAFASIERNLPAGKRALAWVVDKNSRAVDVPSVYLHFPLWYQVEKGGWVDYNFAWFRPQIVRFRPDAVPEVKPADEWNINLPALLKNCARYDLIFLRIDVSPPASLSDKSSCPHVPYSHAGKWYVYALPGLKR